MGGRMRGGLGALVRERCESKGIEEALDLFHRLLSDARKSRRAGPSTYPIFPFNLLLKSILGTKNHQHYPKLISLFNSINRMESLSPNLHTYGIMIDGCCRMGRLDLGLAIFGAMLKRGVGVHTVIFNSLINGLAQARRVSEAASMVRDRMALMGCKPNVITYSILIKGLCDTGNVSLALELLQRMEREGGYCKPTVITYTTIIKGLCHEKRVSEAASMLLDQMPLMGCTPNANTYNTLIKGLCSTGKTSLAMELLHRMESEEGSCKPDVVTYNTLIDALCKEGAMERATTLFQNMVSVGIVPSIVTYNCIIHGHSALGHYNEATRVLKEMVDRGLSPDAITFNTVMDSLCKHGRTTEVHKLFDLTVER